MTRALIRNWIEAENPASLRDEVNIAREIAQVLILRAITDAGLQQDLHLHGGTCLRLFHGLSRYSEDLDYLLAQGRRLDFNKIVGGVERAVSPYGFSFRVLKRDKRISTLTLEDRSLFASMKAPFRAELERNPARGRLRIKIEVNASPPAGAVTVALARSRNIDFTATTCDLPTLFAGKIHAVLSRAKGRDWYDLLWYSGKNQEPNAEFLQNACRQSGVDISRGVRESILARAKAHGPARLIREVEPLLPGAAALQKWTSEDFNEAIRRLSV